VKVGFNHAKYANGLDNLRKVDHSGKTVNRNEEKIEQQNREREICLNCTKKKCRGTRNCFEKERNKHD
jgi:hypothetical protein